MTPPTSPVTLLAPVICVVCTVYKVLTLRPRRATPAQRSLCWLLVCCTFGIVGDTPLLYRRIDALTGVANLSLLITECAGMALTWPGLSLLSYQDHDTTVARAISRRRLLWAPPVFAVELLLWWVAGGPSDPAIAVHRAGDPVVVAEFSVQHVTMLVGAASCGRWCWRFSNGKPRELKVALRTMACSGVLGVVWVFYRWTYYGASLLGVPVHAWGNLLHVDLIALGTATTTFALGSTLPDWGTRARRAVASSRAIRGLQPLWDDLVDVVPEVRRPAPSRRHLGMRLHRRVVEIRDAQHVLGCQTSWGPHVSDSAAAEAQAVCSAVVSARGGFPTNERPATGAGGGGGEPDLGDLRAGLAAEVGWLLQVAAQYAATRPDRVPGLALNDGAAQRAHRGPDLHHTVAHGQVDALVEPVPVSPGHREA